jgi:hypothetical protein
MNLPYDRVADLSRPNPSRRDGRAVKHPAQAWTRTTHSLLAHLEAEGYSASQRVADPSFDDEGNEVLEWIEGDIYAVGIWPQPTESLYAVGHLLRELHEATASFDVPEGAVWMPWTLRETGPGTVVSHGNIAPWHVVFREAVRSASSVGNTPDRSILYAKWLRQAGSARNSSITTWPVGPVCPTPPPGAVG